ncbi:MAG TPA: amino acid adenylation domain-containing protein [Sphingobium sp.]|uniref:non-ribosomal peptide synthetase family protein n=1 Tax=Sphingobium sp. TaxID=1912891 RepID=UPI002ED2F791
MNLFAADAFAVDTTGSFDRRSLVDLLFDQVERDPDGLAAVGDGESLSFADLLSRAFLVAEQLRAEGVGADLCVGLFADSSLDQIVGLWGILLVGGAYLPLAPDYPDERLRYMVEDARATVILCQPHYHDKLRSLVASDVRIIDIVAEDTLSPVDPARLPRVRASDLAYVIYTSGSTGRPKGVMIEHRSIVSQMEWLAFDHGIGPGARILQKTPASFDAAQWELLASCQGATVIVGKPGLYRDPEAILDLIERHQVTVVQCVPTLLKALLETDRSAHCTSLRQLFSGGEALSRELAVAWRAQLPWCAVTNLYGPTECTINSSAHPFEEEAGDGAGIVSIGRPADQTRYYIVDADMCPVAAGEVGELLVSGVQLARGYLHRPDLTVERFLPNPFEAAWPYDRVYRTGDLAQWNGDGTVHYVGRADNQLKLRGYRIELDEISQAIEAHDWVKNAAAVVKSDPLTGTQNLLAYVELSPKQAALMDQGNHGAHHQSKASRLQVRAQLSNAGFRDDADLAGLPFIALPGREEQAAQRAQAFTRKTYRFFKGQRLGRNDVAALLSEWALPAASVEAGVKALTLDDLGRLLRSFGPYRSEERLLPKYAYASPGALYATQLYLEAGEGAPLASGLYYFHPDRHQLIRLGDADRNGQGLTLHFIGKRSAIEPVYRNNIREVLEMEAGHMIGLFDVVLAPHGLGVGEPVEADGLLARLGSVEEDFPLASYAIVPLDQARPDAHLSLFLQAAPYAVDGLDAGQYRWTGAELERVSDQLIERRHVIAINQRVHDRASFGISIVSEHPDEWRRYLDLGRCLQRLQMNGRGIGLMSSGYSSKSGNSLPSDRQIKALLEGGISPGSATYFAIGGPVSIEQQQSEGMQEDIVHMQGPAELIKEDLRSLLPDYMIPSHLVILDQLPQTANGKVDRKALEARNDGDGPDPTREAVAPRNDYEVRIAEIWSSVLKQPLVSVHDDFFRLGGNSLGAVALIQRINRAFDIALPLQNLFDAPNVAALAEQVANRSGIIASRAIRLGGESGGRPVFCWPGLGGYAMNLRTLALSDGAPDRSFFGIQAHGINVGEAPYATIEEMAARDIALIRRVQPQGPYSLWGYSFGARVAFETAWQLEQSGAQVDCLFLIAPGSPTLDIDPEPEEGGGDGFTDPAFLTILFSVFTGSIRDPRLADCLAQVRDEGGFVAHIAALLPDLDRDTIQRITRIVRLTYAFRYSFVELNRRSIRAPITIFKASGDDYSFIEGSSGYSALPPVSVQLAADHYSLLKDGGVGELAAAIRAALGSPSLAIAS